MVRLSMVGTTIEWVMPCVSTASIQEAGENWGRMTRVRPPQTEEIMVVAPAMWKSGTESRVLLWTPVGSAISMVFMA